MVTMTALAFAFAISAAGPMQPDTPPRLPVPVAKLAEMKSMQDIIAASRLQNGKPAPAHLILPGLQNGKEVTEYLVAHYPESLRDSTTTVTPFAWMFVDATGKVGEAVLVKGSGQAALDSLSLGVLPVLRFTPALVDKQPVGVWVPFPVQIGSYAQLARASRAPDRVPPDPGQEPRFTPYTVPPTLLNREAVQKALVQNYPPELKQEGKGGTIMMWLYVALDGWVRSPRVRTTSGSAALDSAAVKVARSMFFEPAQNQGKPVPVWIQLPIVFSVN